jgi:hypothetical protein
MPTVPESNVQEVPPPENFPSVLVSDDAPEVVTADGDELLHWVLLSMSSIVLLAALVLHVDGQNRVVVPLVKVPLPGVCSYKRWTGADCPGCGLTRCFVSCAHGDIRRAWNFNPAGILFFAVTAFQIPYRGLQLWRLRRGRSEVSLGRLPALLIALVIVSLLVQWAVRLCVSLF